MKKILFLLLTLISFTSFGQFNPGKPVYGNQNVYGSQYVAKYLWINNYGMPLNKGTQDQSLKLDGDSLIWYSPSAGKSYIDSTANKLFPKDTNNVFLVGTDKQKGTELFRVRDGSVLFDGTVGTTPTSGAGTRLMWIPAKAAFRAGNTNIEWNDANIGYASFASGAYTTASGSQSHAEGYYTTASGPQGHAEGASTTASGPQSHAEGYITTASGEVSHAEGQNTIASGYYSHAGGYFTTAKSYVSSVFGRYNIARGTTASWVDTEDLFVIGNGSGTGVNSNNALTITKNGSAYIGDATPTTDPILTINTADSTTTLIGVLKLVPLATAPTPAAEGMIYTNSVDKHIYYYNGTAWVRMDN